MSGTVAQVTTAIYARLSLDRKNLEVGVANQIAKACALCDGAGWVEREQYVDNDLSASTAGRRPDYERLLADVQNGRVSRIVVFQLSRLWRNRKERAEGIEILKKWRVSVVCVKGPHLDMSTASGRGVAEMLGAVDTMEVELKSERQQLANFARAQAGLPRAGGPRAFGFEPDGVTLRPKEAGAIKAGYQKIISGGSLRSVARAWNEAGLLSGKKLWGNRMRQRNPDGLWTYSSVRAVLVSPRYAGIRTYTHPDGRVEEFTAAWPGIVPEETYRAAVALLSDPSRRPAPSMGEALLTGVARCGVCGATVHSGGGRRPNSSRAYHSYRCAANSGRHIVRKAEPIERLVMLHVEARLSADDAEELLVDHSKPDVPALIAERESIRQRMVTLAREFARDFNPEQMRAANGELKERFEEIDRDIADAGRLSILGPLIRAEDVAAAVAALDVDSLRAVINELMMIRIMPVGQGARVFRPESVVIEWRHAE